MKVAVLGKGKTGSKVIEILRDEEIEHTIFDSKNKLSKESLAHYDVIICFLAAEPFKEYLNLLIESKIPLVCGTTGFNYSDELKQKIIDQKNTWIVANNFSLGMNLVKNMIETLSKSNKLMAQPTFHIHEIHHTKKLDAPSGTALSWMNWLGTECEITSERLGDVIGYHEITLKTNTEEIKLSHNALDRKIFAEGAIFAAKKIFQKTFTEFGIISFQDLIKKEML
jgi:4-hydroxy-tetrahydrodipicolinate reductase